MKRILDLWGYCGCQIEQGFLDDKSNGFGLESSWIRSAPMLSRLCLVLAIATLYLSAVGTEVVEVGVRRWVDPHWFRRSSYLKIGWRYLRQALVQGWEIPTSLRLSSALDPEPAVASRIQSLKRKREFNFLAPGREASLSSPPSSRSGQVKTA